MQGGTTCHRVPAGCHGIVAQCVAPRWPVVYFRKRPALASVMAPHNSKMKSSVKPNDSKSELSMASAKSIVLVFSWPISQIWVAAHQTTTKFPRQQHVERDTLEQHKLPNSESLMPIKLSSKLLIFSMAASTTLSGCKATERK